MANVVNMVKMDKYNPYKQISFGVFVIFKNEKGSWGGGKGLRNTDLEYLSKAQNETFPRFF